VTANLSRVLLLKIKTTIDGWRNLVARDPDIQAMAHQRKTICLACPHIRKITCSLCNCPLPPKTRAVGATCPDNRWPV
jgi:hypothetical protein